MKAALYIRVSTEEQALEGFSIAAQTTQLNEYCKRSNIEIYKAYVDEGISGQKENRPQFQQMIKDAEKKSFNIILVHKFDRFARRVELSQRVKRQLRKSGVNVVSITEPIEDSPIGFFQEGILELLSEYYVRNLAQESKKGHVERARQGLHNGSVPFGYKLESKNMVINKEQAKIVKWIFDMYVNQGYGSTKIAITLNQHKIPSAVQGQWSHYTVNRILKNYKYIGKIEYDGQVYQGMHEPLVDENTFELVKRYMKERTWKREYRGYNYDKFLLSGLLICGYCKKAMCIQPCKTGKRVDSSYYYKCNHHTHLDAKNQCPHSKFYSTVTLEKIILEQIEKLTTGIQLDGYSIKRRAPIQDIIIDRTSKIHTELERAKQAYLSGVFSIEEYSEIKARSSQEIKDLNTINKTPDDSRELQKKVRTVWERFKKAKTIIEKKNILKEIVENIEITTDGIHFNLVL
jgi:site-specific DNA recombinase